MKFGDKFKQHEGTQMSRSKLAIESMKKTAKFKLNLNQEAVDHLTAQATPIADALESFKARAAAIRRDGNLSPAGQNTKVDELRKETVDKIAQHSGKISRAAIVNDLAQRLSTKVTGARERARQQMQDAPALATELRQSVLPRLLKDGENMRIPAGQTVAKLAVRAAESYAENPGKAELIVNALSVGWPWVADMPEGTLAQVEAVIAGQVAAEEQQALVQAQGIQGLVDHVVGEALQEIREMP